MGGTGQGFDPGPGYGLPPIIPGFLFSLVLATLLCLPLARRLRAGIAPSWLLLAAVGVILAITITPSRFALDAGVTGSPHCDLSRIGPASWEIYRRIDDPTLNVFLFMPLGAAVGLFRRDQGRTALVLASLALPWAIETTQALIVPLGRACQAGDVFDNSAGFLIAFVPVVLLATLLRRLTAD